MAVLSEKACRIIEAEAGSKLTELASRPLNVARGRSGLNFMYLDRARGATRAMAGQVLSPEIVEQGREETSKFRLPKKSKGIQRLLRHFR